jgi:thymidylate synthase
MTIYADTPQHAVINALEHVNTWGVLSSPRGQSTYEALGAQIRIEFPSEFIYDIEGRDLKPAIGILEGLQLIAQTSLPSVMTSHFNVFSRWTDGSVFDGAYGVRAHGMIRRIVEQITSDRDTRQAVITIYDANRDLGAKSSDVPCTLSLQFILRKDALHMVTTMRSNDVWRGLPYDLMQFIMLQYVIADHFEVDLGTYTHNVGSLHLYESDLEGVDRVLSQDKLGESLDMPRKLFSGQTYADFVRRAELLLVNASNRPAFHSMTLFEGYAHALLCEPVR